MIDAQDIIFGITGQSLVYDAPEGHPSSVTSVTVFENSQSDTGTQEFAPTGTVEAETTTTFSATSGAGQSDPRLCRLTDVTSVVIGRKYLATTTAGRTEWVDVDQIDGSTVSARQPLINTFAAASTFETTRITATVNATWVASQNKLSPLLGAAPHYRVRWVYVVAGVTCVGETMLDLVRYPGKHGVNGAEVDETFPGWLQSLPTDHRQDQGQRMVDIAFRAVKADLYAHDRADQALRNPEILKMLVIYKAQERSERLRILKGGGSQDALAAAEGEYRGLFDRLIREPKVLFQVDGGGAGAQVDRTPLWRR